CVANRSVAATKRTPNSRQAGECQLSRTLDSDAAGRLGVKLIPAKTMSEPAGSGSSLGPTSRLSVIRPEQHSLSELHESVFQSHQNPQSGKAYCMAKDTGGVKLVVFMEPQEKDEFEDCGIFCC